MRIFYGAGHAWPWLGALGATVRDVAIGTAVTPAVRRYHPALVAQAFATLEEMFPGRVFLGYGSGESLNESPLGYDWPAGEEQLEMMDEALEMIRRLWNGETVASGSKHFPTKDAKLHTRPSTPPPLYVRRTRSSRPPGRARAEAEGDRRARGDDDRDHELLRRRPGGRDPHLRGTRPAEAALGVA